MSVTLRREILINRRGLRALVVILSTITAPAVFAQEQFIDWQTNYRQALTDAKAAKKPVFLEFRCEA